MSTLDVRRTVLEIVNEVQTRMGVNKTTTLTQTKHASVLLGLLNQLVDEISDQREWMEWYAETTVFASSSVGEYSLGVPYVIHHIYEIAFQGDVAPMDPVDIPEMRRLQRAVRYGRPRKFSIVGTNSGTGNPTFRVSPVPGSAQNNKFFNIALYRKPAIYSTSDIAEEPEFPAQLLIQGLYAKALLEENGGEPTRQYEVAYAEYQRMLLESANRYNSDTGGDVIQFAPMGGYSR